MSIVAGGARAKHAMASNSSHLDDIFSRLEPAANEGLGRIDDDSNSPLASLQYSAPAPADSPRSAWNRVWR